jgi:uncharacterized DUF497 family protein
VVFEWDEGKARANLRKHRVDFADPATVFEDERAVTIAEENPDEERYVTIGRGEPPSASARNMTGSGYEARIRFQQGPTRTGSTF